jgi:peptidoglycan/xylan/chitin deacetylase (PgdA/CDA1 family)
VSAIGARVGSRVSDVLVLAYHAVSPSWQDVLAVSPDRLDRQVRILLDRGYRGVTFREAALGVRPRENLFSVTFDDGYRSVLEHGFPVLSSLGVPATVFVPTAHVGSGAPMSWPGIEDWIGTSHEQELLPLSWDDARRLDGAGWEIGSHTCSHALLPTLADDRLAYELETSRRTIGEMLDQPCVSLAYPYGAHDDRVVRATQRAGYSFACTLPSKIPPAADLTWPRIGLYHADGPVAYRLKISPLVRRLRGSRLWNVVDRVPGRRSRVSGARRLQDDAGDLVTSSEEP